MKNALGDTGHPAPELAETSTDRHSALGLARNLGAAGLRTTLCWQIARTLFRIGFSGSLAVFTGRLIEDGTFDGIALAGALVWPRLARALPASSPIFARRVPRTVSSTGCEPH